jgi:cellulose synthase/poly-beta-1,6-N-acetylglucosamine synthase-like glycosyltransferase
MLLFGAMAVDTMIVYALLFASLYFEVFLLIAFIEYKKSRKGKLSTIPTSTDLPTVTITVPCYNEEKTLAGTLQSLLELVYPSDALQIIVVDDGSTDRTLSIAQSFAQQHPIIKVLSKENGGKASAMNLAFAKSESELIGCLDADSFVDPHALTRIAHQFQKDAAVSAVTPAIMIHSPQNLIQMMQRAEYMIGIFMRRVFGILDSIVVTPGPFSIFRRADVLTVASPDGTIWKHAHGTEDFEMGLRLQSAHKKIGNEPLAHVLTISPNTLYRLYRQRIRWVYGFLMNAWDYKYMLGNPRYGNVGMLVLPTAILSVFGAVYLFALTLFNIASSLITTATKIYTTGLTFKMPQFDLFYLNTDAMLFIVMVLVGMILFILYNSAHLAETKLHKKDALVYLAIYGLVAPLWLTGALARASVGAESKWRVIR